MVSSEIRASEFEMIKMIKKKLSILQMHFENDSFLFESSKRSKFKKRVKLIFKGQNDFRKLIFKLFIFGEKNR